MINLGKFIPPDITRSFRSDFVNGTYMSIVGQFLLDSYYTGSVSANRCVPILFTPVIGNWTVQNNASKVHSRDSGCIRCPYE